MIDPPAADRGRRLPVLLVVACLLALPSVVLGGTASSAGTGGAGTFTPLPPARILDTRIGVGTCNGGCVYLSPRQTRTVQVAGMGGVPTTGARSVVLNLTAIGSHVCSNAGIPFPAQDCGKPPVGSHLTVYPSDAALPAASTLNLVTGRTVANLVTVRLGADGKIRIFNFSGDTQVIADVAGWYRDDTVAAASRYTDLSPARVLDTRTGTGSCEGGCHAVGPGQTRTLQVAGQGGIPPTGVAAVALNLTTTSPTHASHLTVHSTDAARPNASNLNFTAGQTVANLVVVRLAADGRISIYNATGTTQVIADVAGWYGTPGAATGSRLTTMAPQRILDTRTGTGTCEGGCHAVGPGQTRTLQVAGQGGIPPTGVAAVALNLTTTSPTDASHLTVHPTDAARPNASNLNFTAGQTVANLVVVRLAADGRISIFNGSGTTQLIADVAGWFHEGTTSVGGVAPAAAPALTRASFATGGSCSTPRQDSLTFPKVEQRYSGAGPVVKMLGDSLTYGAAVYGSIATVFAGYDLEVNAQGARATPSGAWLVDNGALHLGDGPAVVVIALGTNDPDTTCYGGLVEHVTQSVLRAAPGAKLLWVGPAQWSAAMGPVRADLVAWHDGNRRNYLDWDPYVRSYPAWLTSDGVHLTKDQGYRQRNLVVEGEVSALLAQP